MTPPPSLVNHADFRHFWLATAVSQFGTRVSGIAIPLLAVTALTATPLQMGLLNAAQTIGLLVIGLPAGAWVDRMRKRRLMIWMDICRAALIGLLVLSSWLGWLTLGQLVLVALAVGVATVFFDVAHLSYLPVLIGRDRLLEGNAKLQTTQSVSVLAGPSLGGGIAGLAGAGSAVAATGAGYLVSALQILRITSAEPEPERSRDGTLRAEIGEGLRAVFQQPALRAIACCTASANFFLVMLITLNIIFLSQDLGLSAGLTGLLVASSGVGGVIGALVGRRLVTWMGRARACWVSLLLTQPFALLLPLAMPGWQSLVFAVGWFVVGSGSTVYNIAQVTLRQAICPDRLLGRVNASNRFLVWGTMPLGSVLAGVIAEAGGVRAGLLVGGVGLSLSVLWLLLSPLRKLRDLPPVTAHR